MSGQFASGQAPLLMDGAMGTELYQAGLELGECAEEWSISRPERVKAIHQSYLEELHGHRPG